MTPEQLLDLKQVVVRAPEGLLVLQRGNYGNHLLIQVNSAELVFT